MRTGRSVITYTCVDPLGYQAYQNTTKTISGWCSRERGTLASRDKYFVITSFILSASIIAARNKCAGGSSF